MSDSPIKSQKENVKQEQATNEVKKKVLAQIEYGKSTKAVARDFKIPRSTIQGWLKKGDSIKVSSDNRKHVKFTLKYDILDDIVVKFIRDARECGTAIDGPMIQTLALRKAKASVLRMGG